MITNIEKVIRRTRLQERREGKLEGKIEGKIEGKLEGKLEVAGRLLSMGMPVDVQITELPEEEVRRLQLQ